MKIHENLLFIRSIKQKQRAYSDADRKLLAQLIANFNAKGIIFTARQDAHTREKKDK